MYYNEYRSCPVSGDLRRISLPRLLRKPPEIQKMPDREGLKNSAGYSNMNPVIFCKPLRAGSGV